MTCITQTDFIVSIIKALKSTQPKGVKATARKTDSRATKLKCMESRHWQQIVKTNTAATSYTNTYTPSCVFVKENYLISYSRN